jgi:outer membrane receptor protein involved in Fe transport
MRRFVLAAAALSGLAGAAAAQEGPPPPPPPPAPPAAPEEVPPPAAAPAEVPELTVTATRTRRDPFDLPMTITVFDLEEIRSRGSFVAIQAASRRDAGIWFDERTSTTSDPIIRGFSGFNLLALVDGNTLSTLWGEGGFGADDMYGKVDPEIVERIEVIHGPSSALYGSNALGAVLNLITRSSPFDFTERGWRFGARSKADFASSANAVGFRQEVYGASPTLRFLLGGSAREFDHVRGGGDLGLLEPSDGRERNWDFSGEALLREGRTLRLTVQDSHRDHLKRYYRPTQDNAIDRQAAALFLVDETRGAPWDELEARLYWQEKVDERRFFTTGQRGEAATRTWQAGLRGTRDLGGGHVATAGASFEWDRGDSPDDEQFTIVDPGPKRRAAPRSDWFDLGAYAQDEWRVSRPLSLVASARYDAMTFDTDVDDAYRPPFGDPLDDAITDRTNAVTGGFGAVVRASDRVHFTGNWSRGFRQNAPNFGLRQLGDGALVPNGLLDPTTSDNFEVGIKTRSPGLRFDASYYHSFLSNWQGDFRTLPSYNGQTFFDFNGNGVQDVNEGFVQQVEGGDAWVRGVEVRVEGRPSAWFRTVSPDWSVWASYAWNEGRVDATVDHPRSEPLRHTQPERLILGIRWEEFSNPKRGLWCEVVGDFVGRFDEIPSDRVNSDLAWRRDPQDGTSPLLRAGGGVPGYAIVHFHSGMNLSDRSVVRLGILNLFDRKYRVAHSRMDAPGVSMVASLEINF